MPKKSTIKRRAYSPRKHFLKHNDRRRYLSMKKKNFLNDDQTKAFELFYFKGYTEYEIAEKMGLSQPSISVLIKQTKKVMKTGIPTTFYPRKDTLSKQTPWQDIRNKKGKINSAIIDILRLRYVEKQSTTNIANRYHLSQPQVSTIITACSYILANS